MKKLSTVMGLTGSFSLGVLVAVLAWNFYLQKRGELIAGAIEQCNNVVSMAIPPPWNDELYGRRALLISDCMASNSLIFLGTGSESSCYAVHPIQQQLKHILPSCYRAVSGQIF